MRELLPLELRDYLLTGIDLSRSVEELVRQVHRYLLVEISEMHGFSMERTSKIKQFIGLEELPLRMLYNSKTRNIPNRVAAVATINPGSRVISEDEAQAVRFPIIHIHTPMAGHMPEVMAELRPHLFRAAKWLLMTGETTVNHLPPDLIEAVQIASTPHKTTSAAIDVMMDRLLEMWADRRGGDAPPSADGLMAWLDIGGRGATTYELMRFAQSHDINLGHRGADDLKRYLDDSVEWEPQGTAQGNPSRRSTPDGKTYVWIHKPSAALLGEERESGAPEAPWVGSMRRAQTLAARQAAGRQFVETNVLELAAHVGHTPDGRVAPVMPTWSADPRDPTIH